MYKMMTTKEVIDKLWNTVGINRCIDFTFDNVDEDPDCDPTGWYGIKLIHIFDEQYGVLAMGYYGGRFTRVYEIEQLDPEAETAEGFKKACVNVFQKYINEAAEYNEGMLRFCEKVCVEIEEE